MKSISHRQLVVNGHCTSRFWTRVGKQTTLSTSSTTSGAANQIRTSWRQLPDDGGLNSPKNEKVNRTIPEPSTAGWCCCVSNLRNNPVSNESSKLVGRNCWLYDHLLITFKAPRMLLSEVTTIQIFVFCFSVSFHKKYISPSLSLFGRPSLANLHILPLSSHKINLKFCEDRQSVRFSVSGKKEMLHFYYVVIPPLPTDQTPDHNISLQIVDNSPKRKLISVTYTMLVFGF